MGKFDSKNIKIKAKSSLVSKVFKIFNVVAGAIIGTVGFVGVSATAAISAIGYYKSNEVVSSINNMEQETIQFVDENLDKIGTQVQEMVTQSLPELTEITKNNIPKLMDEIKTVWQNIFKSPMPDNIVQTLQDELIKQIEQQPNGSINVNQIGKFINDQLTPLKSNIDDMVQSVFDSIVLFLYGEQVKDDKTGEISYSKLYIWKTVFITTISIVAILTISGVVYGICRGIDKLAKRKDVKYAKNLLKSAHGNPHS